MGSGHSHAPATFQRAFRIGIAINLMFVGVEAFFGWKINSLALLADAGHNLSDVAGLLLAWGGVFVSRLAATDRHTYGFRKVTILAAFANAMLLLVAMGSLGWEALNRFRSPQPIEGWTMIWVATSGIVINSLTAMLFWKGNHHDINIRGAFLHMVADAAVSAGVVAAGVLALVFGWIWIDPVLSIVIAIVIIVGTWNLLRQSLTLLFDGVPHHMDLAAIRECLRSLPGVERICDLHVWAMGTDQIALTAHLIRPGAYPDDSFFLSAERELHDRFEIEHVTLQVMQSAVDGPRAIV